MATNSPAVMSAIERARMVAAKLSQQIPSGNGGGGVDIGIKRSADTSGDPNAKKLASISDAVGQSLAALKAQQMSNVIVEEYKVPDKLVGLVIGKGGEQIQKIQAEAGCKAVVQPDSNGQPYRVCTITGSRECVDRAKRIIDDIVKRGATDSSMLPPGHEVFEMKLPGNKCGLVIGKNGETIKRLGEEFGVKLVVVQDSNTPSGSDKPLRITGESGKVQRCKEAVMEIINPRKPHGGDDRGGNKYSTNEYGSNIGGGKGRGNDFNNSSGDSSYIRIPSDKAGIVIGKGGESIKEINRRSGAQVEIDKAYRNTDGPDKYFFVRGSYDQIMYAQQLIYEKLSGQQGQQPPSGYFGPNAMESRSTNGSSGGGGGASDASQAYNAWAGAYGAWSDQSKSPTGNGAVSDPMAAWAAYYAGYYQNPAAAAAATGTTAANGQQQAAATPAVNPQTGQPDYSLAWVEYYRSMGMHAEAEAILKQTQSTSTASTTSTTTTTSPSTTTTATSTNATSTSASASSSSTQSAAEAWQNYYYGAYGYGAPQQN